MHGKPETQIPTTPLSRRTNKCAAAHDEEFPREFEHTTTFLIGQSFPDQPSSSHNSRSHQLRKATFRSIPCCSCCLSTMAPMPTNVSLTLLNAIEETVCEGVPGRFFRTQVWSRW